MERLEPAPPNLSQPIPERIVLLLGREAVASRRPRLSVRLIFPLQLLEVAGIEPRPRKIPEDLGVLSLPQHQRAHAGAIRSRSGEEGCREGNCQCAGPASRKPAIPDCLSCRLRTGTFRIPPPSSTLPLLRSRSPVQGARSGHASAKTAGIPPESRGLPYVEQL